MNLNLNGHVFEVREGTADEHILRSVMSGAEYATDRIRADYPSFNRILDIGAHIGSFSVKAALSWPASSIYAFEALPSNYALLVKNVAQLPSIHTFNYAVTGCNEGRVPFKLSTDPTNTGGGGICGGNDSFELDACSLKQIEVWTGGLQFDLMKIDCEGGEEDILRTLSSLDALKGFKVIVGEWHCAHRKQIVLDYLHETHNVRFIEFDPVCSETGLFSATNKNINV